jgi:excisionase family DNA binding protein
MYTRTPPSARRTLLVHHVARRLNRSTRTVRWYVQTGRLKSTRFGKLWTFHPQDVETLSATLQSGEE